MPDPTVPTDGSRPVRSEPVIPAPTPEVAPAVDTPADGGHGRPSEESQSTVPQQEVGGAAMSSGDDPHHAPSRMSDPTAAPSGFPDSTFVPPTPDPLLSGPTGTESSFGSDGTDDALGPGSVRTEPIVRRQLEPPATGDYPDVSRFWEQFPPEVQAKFHQRFQNGDVTPEALTKFFVQDAGMSEPQLQSLLQQLAPDMPEEQRKGLIEQATAAPVEPAPEEEIADFGTNEDGSPMTAEQFVDEHKEEMEAMEAKGREMLSMPEGEKKEEAKRDLFAFFTSDTGKKLLSGSIKTGIVSLFVVFFLVVCGAAIIGGKGK